MLSAATCQAVVCLNLSNVCLEMCTDLALHETCDKLAFEAWLHCLSGILDVLGQNTMTWETCCTTCMQSPLDHDFDATCAHVHWVRACRKAQLLRSTAASFYCFVLGYLLLILANDISLLLMSTAIRSAGSAVLWIYSTLMLQYLVPNQLLGRVMALEMALFTVRLHHCVYLTRTIVYRLFCQKPCNHIWISQKTPWPDILSNKAVQSQVTVKA